MSPQQVEPLDKDDAPGLLTIGALAELSGVTVRTLRYYEELDLITPVKRSQGRYRLYSNRTLKRIRAILALQDLNYSLEDIQATLGSSRKVSVIDNRAERVRVNRASLLNQLQCVESKLQQLQELKQDLNQRLNVLNTECDPCCDKRPQLDCNEGCQHREAHLD